MDDEKIPATTEEMQRAFLDEELPTTDNDVKTENPAEEVKEAEPDPWADVSPVVKQTLEEIRGEFPKLNHRLSSYEGRLGGLQEAWLAAKKVSADGGRAPSKEDITKAASSGAKWREIKEVFPDWVEAMEERLTERNNAIDTDGLNQFGKELTDRFEARLSERVAAARQEIFLELQHKGWEDTVETTDFKQWFNDGGPTAEEREQQHLQMKAEPQNAAQYRLQMIQKYPQWWADKGSLAASNSAADASKLLDAYEGSKNPEVKAVRNKQRLESALTPQGVNAPVRSTKSAQQAFDDA